MSNTDTILDLIPEDMVETDTLDPEQLEQFWTDELYRFDETILGLTVGDMMGILVKGAIRAILGDELYFVNLDSDCKTDEEVTAVMERAKNAMLDYFRKQDEKLVTEEAKTE